MAPMPPTPPLAPPVPPVAARALEARPHATARVVSIASLAWSPDLLSRLRTGRVAIVLLPFRVASYAYAHDVSLRRSVRLEPRIAQGHVYAQWEETI